MNNYKEELKIFQINKYHYDFKKDDSVNTIINTIINNHKTRLDIKNSKLTVHEKENFSYILYSYREEEKDSAWKDFFATELIADHDFKKSYFSFVLFIVTGVNIYAVIGGSGIRVITRYLNERFGIDLYEKFGNPVEDKLISYTVRGIAGVSTQKSETLNTLTSVNQSIDLVEIPTNLTIPISEVVLHTFFSYLDIDTEINFLEIGSYFYIRKKISFDELHEVVKNIEIIESSNLINPISSFIKIKPSNQLNESLTDNLVNKINDEVNFVKNPLIFNVYEKFDLDLVHPKNIEAFVKCDEYFILEPSKKNPSLVIKNRFEIFNSMIRLIAEKDLNLFELKVFCRKVRICGYRNGIKKTEAPFLNHLTLELKLDKRNYFKIDNFWYEVNDNFINKINDLCVNTITENYLDKKFLNKVWTKGVREDDYNNLYKSDKNFYVFDKVLPENIEICDLMYIDEKDKIVYFIHVKKGFDAKIRDLSNQIKIATERLFTAVNDNSEEYEFLNTLIDKYNKVNEEPINLKFLLNILEKYRIEFVFAYRSSKKRKTIEDFVMLSNSNIAKYSTVLCVRNVKNYPLSFYNIRDND